MQRHILNKRKRSCTHISPRVTLQKLKKGFVKGETLRILRKNSSETTFEENNSNLKKKTLDGRRLPTIFDRKPIRSKIHQRESKLLKQNNKEEKEILPFVTQYQPSVSTIKEA